MIKIEYPFNNDETLVRTYSDEGYEIMQLETGKTFNEAVDLYPCRYTYVEIRNDAEVVE